MFGSFFYLLNEYYFNKRYYFYYLVIKKHNDLNGNKFKYQVKELIPISNLNITNNNIEKAKFDIRNLEPILKELDKYWYQSPHISNININKYDFYKEQYLNFYNKAFTKYSALDYFKTVITLFEEARNKNIFDEKLFDKNNELRIPVDIKFKFLEFKKKDKK